MFYSKKLNKFSNISHCFFSRKGGFSRGIYSTLNCGMGSNDNNKVIKKNLEKVSKKMKINLKKLILMNQTHSNKVILITKKNWKIKKFNSDAIITKMPSFALGVVTADCVPIFLYDVKNKIIGCIHAGWRGASTGIIENTLAKFRKLNTNNKILACVGPCIGKNSYEVDYSFYKNFINKSKKNSIYFSKKNKRKKLFDIRKYVNDKLVKSNVEVDHIKLDTFKEKNNFFSYRRSQKLYENDYGRCISVINLISG